MHISQMLKLFICHHDVMLIIHKSTNIIYKISSLKAVNNISRNSKTLGIKMIKRHVIFFFGLQNVIK